MNPKKFLACAFAVLTASTTAKFISLILYHRATQADPIFPSISRGEFLLLSAILELGLLFVLWGSFLREIQKVWVVYTVSVFFGIYHYWVEVALKIPHCGCFGIFKNQTLNNSLDWLAYCSVSFLFLGSMIILCQSRLGSGRVEKVLQ